MLQNTSLDDIKQLVRHLSVDVYNANKNKLQKNNKLQWEKTKEQLVIYCLLLIERIIISLMNISSIAMYYFYSIN